MVHDMIDIHTLYNILTSNLTTMYWTLPLLSWEDLGGGDLTWLLSMRKSEAIVKWGVPRVPFFVEDVRRSRRT